MENLTLEQKQKWIETSRSQPILWVNKILGISKFSKGEAEILEAIPQAIKEDKPIVVPSGNAQGKDFIASCISPWFLYNYMPSKVILTAPCYDNQTEVLTEKRNWQLFRNLKPSDKIACLEKDCLVFRKPIDYLKEYYRGKMIGYKSCEIDFLITPNHRCYIRKDFRQDWQIQEAQSLFGKWDIHFNRACKWRGGEDNYPESIYEMWGFWFGDGYARYGGYYRRCDIVFTQQKYIDYIRNLLQKNSYKFSEYHHGKRVDLVIYDKKLAQFYVSNFLTREGKKTIPVWLRNATPQKLRAFIRGFLVADGNFRKKNLEDTDRIRIYGNEPLALQLQEAGLKAGYVVDFHHRSVSGRAAYLDGRKIISTQDEFDITFLRAKRQYPKTKKKNWHIKQYEDFVYCVKVPGRNGQGVILVRRNGLYHWSGNTDRQVKEIMWAELETRWNNAKIPLPGRILTCKIDIEPDWFMIGFTTKETGDMTGKAQGFHSRHICVIASEAQAIDDSIFEQLDSILNAEINLFIMIGNPLRTSGKFARAIMNTTDNIVIPLDCLESPNYRHKTNVIPGMASYEWIEKKRKEWDPENKGDHPLWRARVRGQLPLSSIDTIFSPELIERMVKTIPHIAIRKIVTSCDPAGMGDDEQVIYGAVSGRIVQQDIMPQCRADASCSRILQMTKLINANHIVIECDGMGQPIADFTRKLKPDHITLQEVHSAGKAEDEERYQNQKAEMWFYAKQEAEAGREQIPDDEYLKQELQEMKYFINLRGRIQIESKDDLKDRIGRSPGRADAWVLNVWGRRRSAVVHKNDSWDDTSVSHEIGKGALSAMAA